MAAKGGERGGGDPVAFEATAASEPAQVDETVSAPRGLPSPEDNLVVVDRSHYAVAGEHARGGLGRILRAVDRRTGRVVAIKEVLPGTSDASARLAREALITANLQHPGIVPVYEVGRWPTGEPFYAMKMVAGRSLRDALDEAQGLHGRLALLPHVVAVAEALAYAHEHGVIHRDLKPLNVIVGEFGETVVIDWGLAKRLDSDEPSLGGVIRLGAAADHRTQVGAVMGTPAYMAPEQADGQPADARVDVYALGAIVYHLLTGKQPHADARTTEEVLRRVREGALPPLREAAPGLPRDLIAVVDKAMAHKPDDRYPTAKQMAEDLRRFLTGQLVLAHDYTTWQRVGHWVRRRRALVTAAGIALAAVVAIGVASVSRVVAERNFAREQQGLAERSSAEARMRLGQTYAEMGRQELLSGRSLRALPLLTESVRLGDETAANRMVVGRALEDLGRARAMRPLSVVSFEFTHDGKGLIMVGVSGEVLLWRFDEGRDAWRIPAPATGRPGAEASPDGRWVVLSGPTSTDLRDATTGAKVADLPASGTWVSFSDDGRRLAVAGDDGHVDVCDFATRRRDRTVTVAPGKETQAALSPDGTRLAVVNDSGATLWDADTGRRVADLCPPGTVCSLARFSHDGKWVAVVRHDSSGTDGVAWLVAARDGRVRTTIHHHAVPKDATFSPDDKVIATPSLGGDAVLWSVPDATLVHTLPAEGHVVSVRFTGDGKRLALGTSEGTALLYDVASGRRWGRYETGTQWIDVAFTGDGNLLATGGLSGIAYVWDVSGGAVVPISGPTKRVRAVPYAPDGKQVAVASEDGSVTLRDAATGEVKVALAGHPAGVMWAEYSADGRRVATASRDRTAVVWDAVTGAKLMTFAGHTGFLRRATFRPDGARLATARTDGTVRIWDTATGKELRSLAHPSPLMSVRWAGGAGSGAWLVSIDEKGETRVFDAESGAQLGSVAGTGAGIDIAISPDGTLMARADRDARMFLYSLPGAEPKVELEGGIVLQIFRIAFSADGRRLLAAGIDGHARTWDVPSGKLQVTLETGAMLTAAAWSPDGRWIATGGLDRRVRLWDSAAGRELVSEPTSDDIYWLSVSPQGSQIAAATLSPEALLWTVPSWHGDLAELSRVVACRVPWRLEQGVLVADDPKCGR
jgi:WD40 repeat protein